MKTSVNGFIAISLVWQLTAGQECGTCGTVSGVACINQTSFATCFMGTPSSSISTCPSGTVCSAATASICTATAASSDCPATTTSNCNVCSADARFACITETSFSFCYGSTTSSDGHIGSTCPAGQYCNIAAVSPDFCASEASCKLESTTAVMNATALCVTKKQVGRFAMPNDTNCTRYYYCYTYGGQMLGQEFMCVGATLFNPNIQKCVQESETFICSTK